MKGQTRWRRHFSWHSLPVPELRIDITQCHTYLLSSGAQLWAAVTDWSEPAHEMKYIGHP